MSVDLPLPMPTGRATSMVSAPANASAPASGDDQGAVSGFDTLMAKLGPLAVPDDQAAETSLPADAAPASDPQAVAPPVLPQLIANLQTVQLAPQASAPLVTAAKAVDKDAAAVAADDTSKTDADAPVPETPAQLPQAAVAPVAPVVTGPVQATLAEDASATAPVHAVLPKARASGSDDVKAADTDSDDKAPAVTEGAAIPPAVIAQVQARPQAQPQAPVQAPKSSQARSSAPVAAPIAPSAAPQAPVLNAASASDQPKASDAKMADTTTTAAAAPAAPVPAQTQSKPVDALAGSLKAARKALTDDNDVQAASAPKAPASGFSLQAQVEAPGAYTASGAQSAGTTQAGSNLARATVETLSNMAVQINRKLSEGNTKFAVELHPADLGKVEVTLSIARDGTTTAHLKFDAPVTAAAFQAQEGELRHQLAQTGLNLDSGSLTFSSRDDNSAGFNQAFAQMQQQNQPQGQQNRQSQARAFKNAETIAADADASAAVDAGLLAQRMNVSSTLALNLIV